MVVSCVRKGIHPLAEKIVCLFRPQALVGRSNLDSDEELTLAGEVVLQTMGRKQIFVPGLMPKAYGM